jgi:multidrug efflux pump subunit AcrA (membrane-fusion protein)
LEVPIDITDARWLKNGNQVLVKSGNADKEWKGRISRISQTVDEATQSINVFVDINFNNAQPIYIGQYLTAIFQGIQLSNIMEIPRAAVFNTNEVFIVRDSLLSKSEIEIKKINQQTLFFNGIPEGIDIVTEPLINVSEKTKVKILGR